MGLRDWFNGDTAQENTIKQLKEEKAKLQDELHKSKQEVEKLKKEIEKKDSDVINISNALSHSTEANKSWYQSV